LTWGQGQCKLKALPNSKFCGNHKGKQPDGLAPEDKEVNEEAKEDVQEEVQEVVQEAVQEAMELVPYDKPTLHFLPAYLDIDMFFVPLDVAEGAHLKFLVFNCRGHLEDLFRAPPIPAALQSSSRPLCTCA